MNKHFSLKPMLAVGLIAAGLAFGCSPGASGNSNTNVGAVNAPAAAGQQESTAALLAKIERMEKQLQEQGDTLKSLRDDYAALVSDFASTKDDQNNRVKKAQESCTNLREEIAKGVVTKSVTIVNDEGIAGTCLEWGTVRSAALRLDAYQNEALFAGPNKIAGGGTWCVFRPRLNETGGISLISPKNGKEHAVLGHDRGKTSFSLRNDDGTPAVFTVAEGSSPILGIAHATDNRFSHESNGDSPVGGTDYEYAMTIPSGCRIVRAWACVAGGLPALGSFSTVDAKLKEGTDHVLLVTMSKANEKPNGRIHINLYAAYAAK